MLVRIPANTATATSNNGFAIADLMQAQLKALTSTALQHPMSHAQVAVSLWGSETITASTSTGSGEHEMYCPFTGTLASGQTITVTLGGPN